MNSQDALTQRKPLYLDREEALALLDMCLMTEAEDDAVKAQTLARLGDLCRDLLRQDTAIAPHDSPWHIATASVRFRTRIDLLGRREKAATATA